MLLSIHLFSVKCFVFNFFEGPQLFVIFKKIDKHGRDEDKKLAGVFESALFFLRFMG